MPYALQNSVEVAKDVLKRIQVIDPTAIIAGGAPRDWVYGRVPKDIDCFFYLRESVGIGRWYQSLRYLGFSLDDMKWGEEIPEHYKRNPNLRCVISDKVEDVPVQLILMREPTIREVEKFPLSISQAWFDGHYIHTHPYFEATRESGNIYLVNPAYGEGDRYVKKILDKYNMPLVISSPPLTIGCRYEYDEEKWHKRLF